MRLLRRLALLLPLLVPSFLHAQQRNAREEAFVDSLLARMTVEEKLGQLNQLPGIRPQDVASVRAGRVGSFLNIVGADTVHKIQRLAVEQSRLHIPLLFGLDVIHGFRTTFPVPLASAATWDPALVESAERVAAVEATAAGIAWTFAPMVDIARDPRWGRIVEGSGEDAFLGSAIAAARVRGFQGSTPGSLADPTTMAATAKHFGGYGGAEGGRDYNTVDMSERTLRDVYLPPYQAAVKAGAASVMGSFNEIGGVPSHANRWLLTDVLRGEWGFDGMVVSDWGAVGELVSHGIAADSTAAGLLALHAGVDMDMQAQVYTDKLGAVVQSVPQKELDEAVRRVLRMKYRLGLFADPYRYGSVQRERTVILAPAHLALARDVARKSMVLLRNEGGVLPLRKDLARLAVIGPLADDPEAEIGPWGALGRPQDAISILKGIRAAVSKATQVDYVRGVGVTEPDTSGFAQAEQAARAADAVVLVLGETAGMSGEASSRASIELPGAQMQLARRVLAAGKPVVVLLANGRPLAIPELATSAPAILETWFLGVQAGPAVADVLFGDASPSGKLPVTFPRATGQIPIYYNHKNTGRPPDPANHFTSQYLDLPSTPLYPFGFGLSYTTFTYGAPQLSAPAMRAGDTLHVRVAVTNSGRRAGDEVVQLYVRDEAGSVTRPVKELKGFQRISLKPSESRTVDFPLTAADLAFWGLDLRHAAEPGWFRVYTGGSSQQVQEARFELRP